MRTLQKLMVGAGLAGIVGACAPKQPDKMEINARDHILVGEHLFSDLNDDNMVDVISMASSIYRPLWIADDMVETAKNNGYVVDSFEHTPRMSFEIRDAASQVFAAMKCYAFATADKRFQDYQAKK